MGGPRLLQALERVASGLRRARLGRLVDAAGPRVTRSFGRFRTRVDGLVLAGDGAAHMHYVQELRETGREAALARLLADSVPPGGTVVDGGAHLGYLTLHAARAAGPGGRVFAFEPNRATVPLLEENVRANGFVGRVTVTPAALGAQAGRATLLVTEGGDTSSLYAPSPGVTETEVDVVALDGHLPPDVRADVVKLDVEGAELEALRGMRGLLERSRPGPVLFVECNPPLLAHAGASAGELAAWLEGEGFDVRWIDERDGSLRPVGDGPWPDGYVNLLCRRPPSGS